MTSIDMKISNLETAHESLTKAVKILLEQNQKMLAIIAEIPQEARDERGRYAQEIIVRKLRAMVVKKGDVTDLILSDLADSIETYPQAWGLKGSMLSLETLGVADTEPAPASKPEVPVVNVGKVGGSRASGIPVVVDQDAIANSRQSR